MLPNLLNAKCFKAALSAFPLLTGYSTLAELPSELLHVTSITLDILSLPHSNFFPPSSFLFILHPTSFTSPCHLWLSPAMTILPWTHTLIFLLCFNLLPHPWSIPSSPISQVGTTVLTSFLKRLLFFGPCSRMTKNQFSKSYHSHALKSLMRYIFPYNPQCSGSNSLSNLVLYFFPSTQPTGFVYLLNRLCN